MLAGFILCVHCCKFQKIIGEAKGGYALHCTNSHVRKFVIRVLLKLGLDLREIEPRPQTTRPKAVSLCVSFWCQDRKTNQHIERWQDVFKNAL